MRAYSSLPHGATGSRNDRTINMKVTSTEIPDVKLIVPRRLKDDRGWFEEMYRKDVLAAATVNDEFLQDNVSFSAHEGTVRGLHFQTVPFAQAKLVGVLAGSIFDVAVDLRRASPTYGRHVAVRLDAALGQLVYVPVGFAHGFCTLEPNTLVTYKVSAYYNPAADRSLIWNDPALGIQWPVSEERATLSAKDGAAPSLASIGDVF
jgi:dTDP-4-dehydrorhamnose 3,5-epimerase